VENIISEEFSKLDMENELTESALSVETGIKVICNL
jgi:hypothetical protein